MRNDNVEKLGVDANPINSALDPQLTKGQVCKINDNLLFDFIILKVRFMEFNFIRSVQIVFVLLSSLAISSSSYGQNSMDILGIKTGISLDEAKKNILAGNAKFEEYPLLIQVGRVKKDIGKSYFMGSKNSNHTQIVVAADASQKVWFVGQAQHFSVGERLEYDSLYDSLIAKYGAPTIKPPNTKPNTTGPVWQPTYTFTWMYDGQNKLLTGSQLDYKNSRACESSTFGNDYSTTTGARIILPLLSSPTCSMLITAEVRFDYSTKKITAFSVSMLNAKLLYEDPILGKNSRERQAMIEKLKDENRSAKTPKL